MASNLLKQEHILTALYKHKALSVMQLKELFNMNYTAIGFHITKLRKKALVFQRKTPVGVFYSLSTKGGKVIGLSKVHKVYHIPKRHTDWEIRTIRHLINTKEISPENYSELLNCYEAEREIKRRKYNELGGEARKMRWVDLIVNTKEGTKAYEIEITKKHKARYSPIVAKLDSQFKKGKWIEIVWVCFQKDYRWLSEVILISKPTSSMSIQIIEEMKGEWND